MATPPRSAAETIASGLKDFFRRSRVSRVRFAENATTPPPALAYLVHFPRVSMTLAGTDSMWIEQDGRAQLVEVRGGEAVVVPANCWNRPQWMHPSTTLNVLFGHKQIGLSYVEHDGKRSVPPAAVKAVLQGDEAPRGILQALLALKSGATGATAPLVDALLRAMLESLQAPATQPKRRATGIYESICMYVQEHFQFPISRDSIASHFRIAPNHVSRLFKNEGQVSFNDYVNYVRINRAKYLLKNHHQSLDDVAASCGYSDASYFCRVFKKVTKLTPSGYRQASHPRLGNEPRRET